MVTITEDKLRERERSGNKETERELYVSQLLYCINFNLYTQT